MRSIILTLFFAGLGRLYGAAGLAPEYNYGTVSCVVGLKNYPVEEISEGQEIPHYKSEEYRDAASGDAVAESCRRSGFFVIRPVKTCLYGAAFTATSNGRAPPSR